MAELVYPVVVTAHDGEVVTEWHTTREDQLAAAYEALRGGFQVCAPHDSAMSCRHGELAERWTDPDAILGG